MKKHIIKASVALLLSLPLFVVSCKKDDPPVPDEQEVITTLKMHVTNTAEGFDKTFIYKVENGFDNPSTGTIQIDTVKLKSGITYSVELQVLNEREDPAEDITKEILEESDEHLFVIGHNASAGLAEVTIANGNKDSKGLPLNQTFELTAGTTAKGQLDVVLLHHPVEKSGLTIDNIAGSETDLYAKYPLVIE